MGKLVRIKEASRLSGFSISSLNRWERNGEIKPDFVSSGGHRYYDIDKLVRKINVTSDDRIVIGYCRVSTKSQEKDLETQKEALKLYCISRGYQFKIISDIGSGINYNKSGLLELTRLIIDGKVSRIVILDRDRLLRFGFDYIRNICEMRNIVIEIVNQSEETDYEKELVEDLLLVLTVFSARMNGKKSHRNKKLVENLKKELIVE